MKNELLILKGDRKNVFSTIQIKLNNASVRHLHAPPDFINSLISTMCTLNPNCWILPAVSRHPLGKL
ncbi:hypothetical protein T11_5705 [Trichinella zimbabwensis]|uniref:Uncharacterized protein n=1 Tax=Trichinella zimbabwensis TaxID=268475 RepID=A0A0V1I542_9BILA|nr:hypothetical protein T11_5705 [Trichinella zimbabwensis]